MRHTLLIIATTCFALEGQAQQVLSLDSCRAMAVALQQDTQRARLQQEVAKYTEKAAKTKYLPHIDAVGGYELHKPRDFAPEQTEEGRTQRHRHQRDSGDRRENRPDDRQHGAAGSNQPRPGIEHKQLARKRGLDNRRNVQPSGTKRWWMRSALTHATCMPCRWR